MGENNSDKIGNKTEKRRSLSLLSKLPYSVSEFYFFMMNSKYLFENMFLINWDIWFNFLLIMFWEFLIKTTKAIESLDMHENENCVWTA